MGILGNFSRINFGAVRYQAGALALTRGNCSTNRPAHWRNFLCHDGATAALALVGAPQGYYPPAAWRLPIEAGALVGYADGEGEFSGNGALGLNADASLSGAGDLAGALALILSAVAALSGSTTVSASIAGKLEAIASLAGSGDLSAALGAIAGLASELSGSGSVSAGGRADAYLSAAISSTGDLLTTANVGEAVWSRLLESGYTAEEVLRIVSAVVAGKVSGGPDSPVFRDLGDTKDRVAGSADSSGNRTAVTYDAT